LLQHDAQFDYYGKRLATCSSDRVIKVFFVPDDQQAQNQLLAELKGCATVLPAPLLV
jgi:protein transport protein SEC13